MMFAEKFRNHNLITIHANIFVKNDSMGQNRLSGLAVLPTGPGNWTKNIADDFVKYKACTQRASSVICRYFFKKSSYNSAVIFAH